jgi:cytochrome c oxidase subunit II
MMFKTRRLFVCLFAALLSTASAAICLAGGYAPQSDPLEIRIVARRFSFVPDRITVVRGRPVRLVVTSEDVDHGLAIDEFGLDQIVKAGQTRAIDFTPDKTGKFTFYCSVLCGDGHPDMVGEIEVISPGADKPGRNKAGINVHFDQGSPGVVIVESDGGRFRIDTIARTVTPIESDGEEPPSPATARRAAETHGGSASEPYDYRIVNIPTPKRVPRHSLSVYFTHRFQQPVSGENVRFKDEASGLFGLDSSSVSSFGFMYGITDRLYAVAYRSPICQPGVCKTIELGLGYHLLDEAGRSPIALSAYASVEGNDNFSEEYTYNIQAMIGRSVTKYVNLFFSPAVHINSNAQSRFNPPPIGGMPFELGQHTGSFGFGVNARIRPTASLLFEYTPRVGFKQGALAFDDDEVKYKSEAEIGFGIEKRIGRHSFALTFTNTQGTTTSRYNSSNLALAPARVAIGFNLYRRLF